MTDILFELGDIAILLTLWLTLGGDLAVIVFLTYAVTGIALATLQSRRRLL